MSRDPRQAAVTREDTLARLNRMNPADAMRTIRDYVAITFPGTDGGATILTGLDELEDEWFPAHGEYGPPDFAYVEYERVGAGVLA